MTFSFRVVRVINYQMAYRKDTAMCVWGHNLLILHVAHMQLGRCPIIVHSFAVVFAVYFLSYV